MCANQTPRKPAEMSQQFHGISSDLHFTCLPRTKPRLLGFPGTCPHLLSHGTLARHFLIMNVLDPKSRTGITTKRPTPMPKQCNSSSSSNRNSAGETPPADRGVYREEEVWGIQASEPVTGCPLVGWYCKL